MSVGIYASVDAMTTRYGVEELASATNLEQDNTGVIVTPVLASAIEEANSIVDGYVSARYPIPLQESTPALVGQACAIARYLLWKNRASDRVLAGYDAAIAYLKDVARGLVALGPGASLGAPAPAGGPRAVESDQPATMTLQNLADYTDPQQ